jgi:hypothetical protein
MVIHTTESQARKYRPVSRILRFDKSLFIVRSLTARGHL